MKKFNKKISVLIISIFLTPIAYSTPINQFINSVSPPMNANSVIKSSNIFITFEQSMNGSTMIAANVKVFGSQTGLLTVSLDYNSVSNTLTINPTNEFKNCEKISVTLTSGIKTISNQNITPLVFSFRARALGGTGSFVKSSSINSTGEYIRSGDIDGDGDIDLLINEKIYKNNGSAVFSYFSFLTISGFSIMADFDNDGDLDIIVRKDNLYDNYLFINDGLGNFSQSLIFAGGLGNFGDLNGDGFLDYCYYFSNNSIKTVFNSNGIFNPDNSYNLLSLCFNNSVNYIEETPLINDLDNDGDLDIVGINGFGDGNSITFYNMCRTFYNLTNNGMGDFTVQSVFNQQINGVGVDVLFMNDTKLFDKDNDGLIDINSPRQILKNNGNNNFNSNGSYVWFDNSADDDFNGDSFIDLFVSVSPSPFLLYMNDGSGNYNLIVNYNNSYSGGSSSADYDNDGDIDIATKEGNINSVAILLNGDSPLPVEINSFTSQINSNSVKLNWSTSTEQNNSGFEIQRSAVKNETPDAWTKIGFTEGQGNSNSTAEYSFEDKNLTSGKYKYRLKQIDFNGNFEFYDLSNEVVIGIPASTELMQNYPNPFNPVTNISYRLSENGFVTLRVFDNSGREVKTLINEFKEAGYYSNEFNGSDLASGIYFYKLTAGNFVQTKKLSLVK